VTTVAALRTTYLNNYLERTDADTLPWTTAELGQQLTDCLTKLWPKNGIFTFGDVASSSTSMLYTVPAAFGAKFRISRIEVLDSSSLYVDRVLNWRAHSPTQILVKPLLQSGLTLRMYGWKPFAVAGTDLDSDLEPTVAQRAAGRAFGALAARLLNSQRQQNLDSGRVVSYQDAIGLSAYYERLYAEGITDHPSRVSYSPRAAHRA
jgi:hypothetical protein